MWEAIFQFLFKYPPVAYSRGRLTLASAWPAWILALAVLLVIAAVGLYLWRRRPPLSLRAGVWVGCLQSLTLAIVLLLLWRPSLVVSTLVPQQNVLAVLLDDSSSMAMTERGARRLDSVQEVFADSGALLSQFQEKFQVRLYKFSKQAQRISSTTEMGAAGNASRLEDSVAQVYEELRHLPLAGMVVASDGAQNGSTMQRETLEELKARKIPVYTLGVGEKEFSRDMQVDDVTLPHSVLPGTLVSAAVTIRQRGYLGQTARLELWEGDTLLKKRDIRFGPAPVEVVHLSFTPQSKGLREYNIVLVPLPGEALRENNAQSRLIEVRDRSARVLYIEGEPRWEYKFLRRALEEDANLHLVSLLRTSPNKFYRQGIEDPKELGEGFPTRKELFRYEGLLLGSINASFFSPEQQEDIYSFVSRRGGGALFLGGRFALADGGYQNSSLADLLPVHLSRAESALTFLRTPVRFQLTPRGWDRLQLAEDEQTNREQWEKLPPLGNYQLTGEPKPGAVVLGEAVTPEGKNSPILVSQRFGRGRVLVFATDGSWRWRMEMESTNRSHEVFWRQLIHSLVNDTPSLVSISAEKPLYLDEEQVRLVAQVYDEEYQPVNGATAVATIHSPDGKTHELPLQLSPEGEGLFRGGWQAVGPGVYQVEVVARLGEKELGKSSSYFQRADGLLEYFSAEQNVSLLTRFADQTGGRYYPIEKAGALPEQLTYSPAGVSVPEVRELWDMPFWLLLIFLLKGTEWVLRKRWRTI
ncbi:MAG: hypothetical protein HY647_12665 [Acidobacteria bacterium]|nr:hypothetical protein [Acidobacteriota bacterium]